jgi:RNA polymerase sigma-54 factor
MTNGLRLGLSQKLAQTLKMTPEMQLAIKLLQLNSVELKEQINEILETNPLIELDERKTQTEAVSIEKMTEPESQFPIIKGDNNDKPREDFGIDWQKYIEDSENTEYKVGAYGGGGDEESSYENYVTKKENLREHLLKQISELGLNSTQQKIGEYLVGLVDRNGYIRYTNEQIAQQLKVDLSVIALVRERMAQLDPLGVAAYDLQDCLLIQAREEGYTRDAVTAVIEGHLDDVAQNRIGSIVKATGYAQDEVLAAIETIKGFNPKPGAAFPSYDGEEIYVTPEVFIEKVDGEYVVSLNERDMPALRINSLYREAIKNKESTEKETYEFIKSKLDSAQSFLRFIDKRKETILSISQAICEVQREFFENGILHLKPLTLQDIAQVAGVHESTVSRATNGKYAQTPRGLLELKFFFSGAAATQSGEDVSTMAVKKRIEELIKDENPKKPLSDNAIVNLLKEDGVVLARRTVAKYREQMNIPGSSVRKVL